MMENSEAKKIKFEDKELGRALLAGTNFARLCMHIFMFACIFAMLLQINDQLTKIIELLTK